MAFRIRYLGREIPRDKAISQAVSSRSGEYFLLNVSTAWQELYACSGIFTLRKSMSMTVLVCGPIDLAQFL